MLFEVSIPDKEPRPYLQRVIAAAIRLFPHQHPYSRPQVSVITQQ